MMTRWNPEQVIPAAALLILLLLATGMKAYAQDRMPREYTNPEEMISMDRETTFPEAIEILNEYSVEFQDRLIVDRTGYSGTIGFNLPPMHWKDALHYILRVHNMALYEDPDFYEVLTREELEARGEPQEIQDPGDRPFATTGTREVRINATFFEGNRRALREVGVDWSTLTSGTPDVSGYIGDTGSDRLPGAFDNRFVSVNAAGAQSVSQSVFNSLVNLGDIGAGIEVQALFSAFEADNLGELIATPSVKVMDGEEGRIQVGEDFSIKQRDFAGNVIDQFFSTGTILRVTPHVIDYQDTTFIYLDLHVEQSSAQPDPVSTVITKEEATTHSLLLNGESTVIAGLYRTDRSEVRRGIPILKDLPKWFFGLRYLFGYNSTDVSQTELVVLVQAELEETIPTRIARQLRSQRDILEEQQQRHRDHLDFIPRQELDGGLFEEFEEAEQSESQEFGQPYSETGENAHTPDRPAEAENRPSTGTGVDTGTDREVVGDHESAGDISDSEQPRYDDPGARPDPDVDLRRDRQNRQPAARSLDGAQRTQRDEQGPETGQDIRYFTIAGTFESRSNADNLLEVLKSEGFEARILSDPDREVHQVAYAGFADRSEAVEFTRRIQRTQQEDAWLSIRE